MKKIDTKVLSVTFSEVVETHTGMQKTGTIAEKGYSYEDLLKVKNMYPNAEIYCINDKLDNDMNIDKAYVLVIKNFIDSDTINLLNNELLNLKYDTKFLNTRTHKVLNKLARHNLCFADESQEANYEKGNGTVVSFSTLPELSKIRNILFEMLGDKLYAEANLYYSEKCGIGYHGDTERMKVSCLRLGNRNMNIIWRWYLNSKRVGDYFELNLSPGDFYIMSEKAAGNDWKKRKFLTLRHAAGHKKYTN